jgi:hypothetical protein
MHRQDYILPFVVTLGTEDSEVNLDEVASKLFSTLAPAIARRARECGAKTVGVSYVEDGRDLEENDLSIPAIKRL